MALTRIVSAVFRKGGDVTFLVEELRSVFDPRGGYFKKGGRYMPSLVAEIGDAIEAHMRTIGLIKDEPLDESQRRMVEEKRAQYKNANSRSRRLEAGSVGDGPPSLRIPDGAQFCMKCQTQSVVRTEGCMTCLTCGDSKCG